MAAYFMGIDLGTSSVRAYVIDFDQNRTAVAGEGYDVQIPQLGYAEQDPQLWYEKATAVIRRVLSESGIDPREIVAVSFSGQMHGLVALDEADRPVMNVPLWLDQRCADDLKDIYAILGEDFARENLQNRIGTGFLMSSLYWMKVHQPALYARTARVMLPKDYIKFRLSGRITTDFSDASGSLAFDNVRMCWSEKVLNALGLNEDIFPQCLPSTAVIGTICAEAARDTGLWEGTLVVNGGADQCMQAIGNAAVGEGVFASNIGTSSLITTAARQPLYDPRLRTNTFAHALPGCWSVMAACLNGGSVLKWLSRKIFDGLDYEEINRMVEARPCGATGLFFLPYMAGERTPHMDPKARGVFFGLTLDHGRGDMARALMEGIVYGLKDGLGVLEEIGIPCRRIVAAGGGARSDVWLQMQADIFEKDVYRSASKEQACLGAAITAAVGAGVFRNFDEACDRCVEPAAGVFHPREENVRLYRELYPIFRSLYTANRANFESISRVYQVE